MRVFTSVLGGLGLFVLAGACGGDDSNATSSGDDAGVLGDGAIANSDGAIATADGATSHDGSAASDGSASNDGSSMSDASAHNDTGAPFDAGPTGPAPTIGGCQIFPNDNPWNTRIDDPVAYPVHPNATAFATQTDLGNHLHADWGDYSTNHYGIPWQTVGAGQTKVPMVFQNPQESDPGPYPFPLTMKIEAPSDSHGLVLDTSTCILYESGNTVRSGSGFGAYSGAKFDLHSNTLRPDGWTSGDAAGLPILPGLVRLAEVQAGAVNHAIRFTLNTSQNAYIHPAVHAAGSTNTSKAPMGLRYRLKASFSLAGFSGPSLVILTAMKKYGVILADNGTSWYIGGDSDDGWANIVDTINQSWANVHGSDFEPVYTGPTSTAGL